MNFLNSFKNSIIICVVATAVSVTLSSMNAYVLTRKKWKITKTFYMILIGTDEAEDKREGIWDYLKEKNPEVYRRIRRSVLNMGTNLPTNLGRKIGITGYHVAQRIFKFN